MALRALIRAEKLGLSEVLDQDLRLAESVLNVGDFVEGVRALLIEKNTTPTWRYATIEDVPTEEIDKVFDYRSNWHR
ncbi:enoyl-CoA hydratase/isomerase family protein [Tessaracoccus sp. HDW20]|nr:enoyl-CoA hydratase/isomerase family protein [Tessaracoccus coleopterorum]